MYKKITQELNKLKNSSKAQILQRFFKTGKGEYGEGDIFLGITVPKQREVVKTYFKEAGLDDVQKLLNSKIHEHRMVGVLILVEKYRATRLRSKTTLYRYGGQAPDMSKKQQMVQKELFNFYLKNTLRINNWDLVDLSAPNIVGQYLLDVETRFMASKKKSKNPKDTMNRVSTKKLRQILYKLARSKNLWERRISILATLAFIRTGKFQDTIKISEILLKDKHDLIHKAVGWMLREMGKGPDVKSGSRLYVGKKELIKFLNKHTWQMPRTMLRYAIERLPEKKRKYYLNK